jgi:NAD(P)-dependent dehydrogenase (short-subunit alcohol dehydrogenase family)
MYSGNILITGASSGIGNAVANRLRIAGGAKLFLVARDLEKLTNSLPLENFTVSDKYFSLIADLTDDDQLHKLIQNISEPLDSLVLCAGELKYKPVNYLNRADLTGMLNINFLSPVLLLQGLLKARKINKGASVVFISSVSARVGVPATLAYAASKAAIEASVRVFAAELAPKKIKVNAVCPGLVNTPMLEKASENNGIDIAKMSGVNYPLGIGSAEDVAALITFLISKENNWITGQNIVIDGGYLLNK